MGEMEKEILTPEHRLWDEFYERLSGPEGIDFRPHSAKGFTWRCGGGRNKDLSAAILRTMPTIDVEGTLAYFEAHGGHCDCRIVFNVGSSDLDNDLH
jgi:hypothetical protein